MPNIFFEVSVVGSFCWKDFMVEVTFVSSALLQVLKQHCGVCFVLVVSIRL